ncbi:MAG: hypothetical protein IKH78_01200 [Ruminococcus sp.]|nr:hypothetical protein [Ruminococcus sp.]MBR6967120.1 hypothetical protein [Ruminococcus sp.]
MSAMMQRKKNIFEKLAPLWALLGTALNIGVFLYIYLISDSYEAYDNYNSFLKYIIWAGVVLVSTLSFVPESVTAIVKHTVFYLISSALGVAFVYYYAFNVYDGELTPVRAFLSYISSGSTEEYAETCVKTAAEYSLYICGAVAAFCAVKYHMSSSGWINKRIK